MHITDNSGRGGALNSVAIIMDGNGRWATRRGLPRNEGHIAGARVIEKVIREFRAFGVHYLTLYAFSTENWKRPRAEIDGIMELIYRYIRTSALPMIHSDPDVGIMFLGDKSPLPDKLRKVCLEAEELSRGRPYIVSVALNYGGRADIINAVNSAIRAGHTSITEEILSRYTYTSFMPDPDLIIRTGGEHRLSNFLLWQSAYSELIVLDTLWPDFSEMHVRECVAEYNSRVRRFGGLKS